MGDVARVEGAKGVEGVEGEGCAKQGGKDLEAMEEGARRIHEGVTEVHGEGDRMKMASGSSQRPQQGIGEMRQMVNRLVRRIHYSAFVCPARETWVDFHRAVDKSHTAAEVAQRLVWAANQVVQKSHTHEGYTHHTHMKEPYTCRIHQPHTYARCCVMHAHICAMLVVRKSHAHEGHTHPRTHTHMRDVV